MLWLCCCLGFSNYRLLLFAPCCKSSLWRCCTPSFLRTHPAGVDFGGCLGCSNLYLCKTEPLISTEKPGSDSSLAGRVVPMQFILHMLIWHPHFKQMRGCSATPKLLLFGVSRCTAQKSCIGIWGLSPPFYGHVTEQCKCFGRGKSPKQQQHGLLISLCQSEYSVLTLHAGNVPSLPWKCAWLAAAACPALGHWNW